MSVADVQGGGVLRIRFKTLADFHQCYVRDLSRGGIFVNARRTAAIGAAISVVLTLPDGDEIRLHGRVVHVTPPSDAVPPAPGGMGIEFVDMTPELQKKLGACAERGRTTPPSGQVTPPTQKPRTLGVAPVETVQPRTTPKSPAPTPPHQSAAGEEIELLRRLCWLLARPGSFLERPLEQVLGVPGAAPEMIRRAMFERLRNAVQLGRPPAFMSAGDALELARKLQMIETLVASGDS
jgi:uncharacterized protein (TIGR02266 family)